ncbi:MAG TPA: hypothetical protein VGB20_00260 [bacterium]
MEQTAQELTKAIDVLEVGSAKPAGYDVVFRRDPMQPLLSPQGAFSGAAGMREGMMVQGIIWSPTKPLVVVEDELLGVGQQVGPYTLKEIRPDGALVQRGSDEPIFVPVAHIPSDASAQPAE